AARSVWGRLPGSVGSRSALRVAPKAVRDLPEHPLDRVPRMREEEGVGEAVQRRANVCELVRRSQEDVAEAMTNRQVHPGGGAEAGGPEFVVIGDRRGTAPLDPVGDVVRKDAPQPEREVAQVRAQLAPVLATGPHPPPQTDRQE